MLESHSDLWTHHREPGHLVCISVNGFVKKNGCAVMGRGCALQATKLHLGIAKLFGDYLRKHGNVPGVLVGEKFVLGILPVKHVWWEKASLELIQKSVDWLDKRSHEFGGLETIHVPRLGCGNGGRKWLEEVRPLMLGLGDNVEVHS